MAVGTIDRAVLGAIADAIRAQAGTAGRLLPGEMAAAVAALDGSREGEAASYPAGEGRGLVSDTVFAAIADAIRVQNGLTEKYTPSEMAGAILALEWDMGLKPRAVLLEGWVLELNYLDRRRGSGGERVLMSWDVPAAGVSSAGQLPWADDRAKFAYVRVDASFLESGVASAAYWFWAAPTCSRSRASRTWPGSPTSRRRSRAARSCTPSGARAGSTPPP